MDTEIHGKENVHVMQVPTSPSFLKPKPIKLRKRTKRPAALPLTELNVNCNASKLGYLSKSPITITNPFRCKSKRKKIENDEDSNSLLWKRTTKLLGESDEEIKVLPSPIIASVLDENAVSAFSEVLNPSPFVTEKTVNKPKAKEIPVDWSLKTKIRFMSPVPFPCRGSFRTFEEVNGTVGFVRCLHSNEDIKKSSDIHSSYGSKFFQQCLVWMHPSLPWMKLFPRTDDKLAKQNSSAIAVDVSTQEILHSAWCDSFRSLYQLVRLFQCPYFYMCAPTFTVLFRCAGAASIPVIHAMISPTTKGFRKALNDEGIAFTMPLRQSKDSDSIDELIEDSPEILEAENDENKETMEVKNDADDETTWLESLGLSQDALLASNNRKPKLEESRKIDHKPESLVYIEDSETQALVNFLLNSQLCTSKFGPMAGIPPTLLAPTAFLGGTLQSLKIRHGKVKMEKKELESVEISGPLLPNAIHSLCSLFKVTQNGQFSSTLTSFTPSVAFSMVNPLSPILPCIFAQNNVTDCGFPSEFVKKMCSKPGESVISSIAVDDGLFTWK
ncbi:protein downstream neighbor of Son-like [Uloborus diversus]|uniref:protein downstream neighbor of Son-like n=1 Tax=Uloborus diversus TaxID=327109 RepID=UPI00240A09BA|nr:protein downstream neighbor of Son-like [Uloborus diversus]